MPNMGFETNAETQRSQDAIANDAWFVAVNLFEFCNLFSISKTFNNDLLIEKLIYACDEVNQSLKDYALEQQAKGFNSLEQVPAPQIGGKHVKVTHYKRAVYAKAKAELIKDKIHMDRKPDAENSAGQAVQLSENYERMASKAIAYIQGVPAIGVHII
jgi:hypothetical protein